MCGWVFFDLPSFSLVAGYFGAMFGFAGGGLFASADIYYLANFAVILIAAVLASTRLWKIAYDKLRPGIKAVATPLLIAIVLVLATAYLVDNSYNPFIYLRF